MRRILFLFLAILIMPAYAAGAEFSVHEAVRHYIEANATWPPETIRVNFLTEEPDLSDQKKTLTLRVEPAGYYDFIGNTSFLVRFYEDATLLRTETVRTRIEVRRNMVVASKALPAGTILTEGDLLKTKKWVHRINTHAIATMKDAIGKRLTRQIQPGMEIVDNMLREVPLIKKGKPVKVIYHTDLMKIVTVALPEEDGSAGAIIKLRNLSSNKIIYGRVVSDSIVELNI
ncbi:MAG: flagellar basal body P-ring formation protein FlgA [Deltaproteobacteria bacterium]|nr:flagellar basal body P-ring formation protein FlgA [Deltaproteobacteria bacterium]